MVAAAPVVCGGWGVCVRGVATAAAAATASAFRLLPKFAPVSGAARVERGRLTISMVAAAGAVGALGVDPPIV